MNGYEIKACIEQSLSNFWSESYGQLYPQLAAVTKMELAEVVENEKESRGRKKKTYKITQKGRDALATWIDEEPNSRPPRDELLMKLFFASEGNLDSIIEHCIDQKYQLQKKLKKYESIKADLEKLQQSLPNAKYWLMTVRFGIVRTEAILKWLDEVISELQP